MTVNDTCLTCGHPSADHPLGGLCAHKDPPCDCTKYATASDNPLEDVTMAKKSTKTPNAAPIKAGCGPCACCGETDCYECGPACKCGCLLLCDGCCKCCCCCECDPCSTTPTK